MASTRDTLLLAIDDAAVTLGSQFREIALGLTITALNPYASSYSWYFMAASVPGLLLARTYAWASVRWSPRRVMTASYLLRFLLVLILWRIQSFWAALACLAGMSAGSGLYSASQAYYVATAGDYAATRTVVMRLRQSESLMRLVGPLLAGAVLSLTAFRQGFLVSAGAYVVAVAAVSHLSSNARGRSAAVASSSVINWRPDMPALAILGLSFLTWQANTLAVAYTFHVLHRQEFGFGLTLSAWGGSGLLASYILHRVKRRPLGWIPLLFALLAGAWLWLSRGVSFPVFVALGGVEGFASWLIQDLVMTHILSGAQSGQAGTARARLGAVDEVGSIAGTATILLVPAAWLVLPMYQILAGLGLVAALLAFRARERA